MPHLTVTSMSHLAKSVIAAVTFLVLPAAVAAQGATPREPGVATGGEVFVIQGVPDSTVGVTLDGDLLSDDVEAKDIIGPLNLVAGEHTIDFKAADWAVSSSFEVAGASTDIVLHWPADLTAQPEVTVFANDVAPVVPDKGRLTLAHTAVVPPADLRVDDEVLFANIANGEFISSEVAADTYSVDLVPTGQDGPALLGPVELPVKAGTLTRVFAIGEPRNGSMDAVVQTLPLSTTGSAAPDKVDAGSAGLVDPVASESTTSPASNALVLVWTLCSLAGVALLISVARRRLHL